MKRVSWFAFFVLAGLLIFSFAQIGGQGKTGDEKDVPTEATHPGLVPVANPLPKMALPPETDRAKPNFQSYPVITGIGSPDGASDPNGIGLKEGKDYDLSSLLGAAYGNRINSDIVSDWRGRLYVAVQVMWNSFYHIQLFRSVNYGKTWATFGYVLNASAHLTEPSLCVGSGSMNGYKLVCAYVVSGTPSKVQLFTQDISGDGFVSPVAHDVYCFNNNYARPKVWTEFNLFGNWWIMLAAEWQFSTNNTNIHYWRSTDGGTTWPTAYTTDTADHRILYGNTDDYNWTQPDGVVGYGDRQYVVVYNKTDRTLHVTTLDYTANPDTFTEKAVYTLPAVPAYDVNPGIAANYYLQTQMITFNKYWAAGDDDVNYLWTTNNGTNWAGPYGIFASTSHEYGAKVNANPGQTGQYHVAANKVNDLVYRGRGMASAGTWSSQFTINDAAGTVSGTYWKKGVFPIISSDTPAFTWAKIASPYTTWFDRLYPDDLVATWTGQGVYYKNTDSGTFSLMASPATKITVGDFDGDKTGDLVGIWPGQGGVWIKKSTTGAWTQLSSTADWITAADMNGDGNEELLGTWAGTGVFWRNNATGVWTQLATPATQIAGADLDHDGIADLIGIWPSQGGVWARYSIGGNWVQLASSATWIGTGDMNGDGYDELLGSWTGQGVYWRNSTTGVWTLLATPASMIGSGDLDGDKKDDLLGVWPAQGGVWVRYSETNNWALLGSTPVWISSGQMRSGDNPWAAGSQPQPFGGLGQVPMGLSVANEGPGGYSFSPKVEKNLVPSASRFDPRVTAGPGMSGFVYATAPNPVPGMRSPERPVGERRH